jgi:hypothetical protein
MDKIFFVTVGLVGVISAAISFVPSEKISWPLKIVLFIAIAICLLFQGWYGWQDKNLSNLKAFKDALYQNESLRGQVSISQDIKELKAKEKKGLLSESDHSLYIARYLESIDQTLKFRDGKNTREWVTTYYDEVNKIPQYLSLEDWKESEKLIYNSMVNELNGHFAARGAFDSGMRPKLLETFKIERERVIKAKESGK